MKLNKSLILLGVVVVAVSLSSCHLKSLRKVAGVADDKKIKVGSSI